MALHPVPVCPGLVSLSPILIYYYFFVLLICKHARFRFSGAGGIFIGRGLYVLGYDICGENDDQYQCLSNILDHSV